MVGENILIFNEAVQRIKIFAFGLNARIQINVRTFVDANTYIYVIICT